MHSDAFLFGPTFTIRLKYKIQLTLVTGPCVLDEINSYVSKTKVKVHTTVLKARGYPKRGSDGNLVEINININFRTSLGTFSIWLYIRCSLK